uniref:DYW domain-containing protein n=1 Tax=Kalanchoe fedtschenkoi TaxID=63787 RepID=A0A7N0VJB4_KALFE
MLPVISLSTSVTANVNLTRPASSSSHKPRRVSIPTFSSALKSLSKSGKLDEAVQLIESSDFKASDSDAYELFLHACISRRSLQHGQRFYLQLLLAETDSKRLLLKNPVLRSKLITLYSVCGRVDEARRVFEDDVGEEAVDESVWVAMGIGFLRNGDAERALGLYGEMLERFVVPGNFALSMALKACALLRRLEVGKALHAQIVKCEEKPDQVVYNALLKLYSDCGAFDEVMKVFDEMPERNVASWNSLIVGFVARDQLAEALNVFRMMQRKGMTFSWVTLTSILPVCSRMTALYTGREVHAQILKSSVPPDVPVMNSVLDMYAKCGAMEYCIKVFDNMQIKDLTSWNTVLGGYAMSGRMLEGVELFHEMVSSGVNPDDVTFITLLSGCSHSGLTDIGQQLFDAMEPEYGISPVQEHYACLVDILGRAGRIEEAISVVKTMPMKPSGSVWGSLLNSSRLHNCVTIGEFAAKHLFELEPLNPGNYVILSNLYANARMWEGVKMVRELMERRGVKKEAGCSWIQTKNGIRTFVAGGDHKLRNSAEYVKLLAQLTEAMEKDGYAPNTSVVLHDVDERLKNLWVCGHSERIATVFALINTGSTMPIRIAKNLRVCVDCHSWMKSISRITERTIILRDTNHFHYFKGGTCSCQDYWLERMSTDYIKHCANPNS